MSRILSPTISFKGKANTVSDRKVDNLSGADMDEKKLETGDK